MCCSRHFSRLLPLYALPVPPVTHLRTYTSELRLHGVAVGQCGTNILRHGSVAAGQKTPHPCLRWGLPHQILTILSSLRDLRRPLRRPLVAPNSLLHRHRLLLLVPAALSPLPHRRPRSGCTSCCLGRRVRGRCSLQKRYGKSRHRFQMALSFQCHRRRLTRELRVPILTTPVPLPRTLPKRVASDHGVPVRAKCQTCFEIILL